MATFDQTQSVDAADRGERRRELSCVCLIAVWPFAFFFPYTFRILSPGNDFGILYYNYKVFYLASLAHGHFQLWNPMEAVGFPFFANPFVQPLYPLNLIYLLHYEIFDGLSYWAYTLYTIAAFSIFGVGLYLWLRRLNVKAIIALTTVVIALMSLKVTGTIRFPNAAHSAAWMPWLLYALTLSAHRTTFLKGCLIALAAAFALLTAGYPYYIAYAVVLIVPYGLALLFTPLRSVLAPSAKVDLTNRLHLILGWCITALISLTLAFPWLYLVKQLMDQTQSRDIAGFNFSVSGASHLLDTVGSLLFPPVSSFEGWFYFGVSALLVISTYIFASLTTSAVDRNERRILAMIGAWMAAVVYFTWGRESYLFSVIWHNVPLIQPLRAWSRMDIILVPPISFVLALALSGWCQLLGHPGPKPASKRKLMISVLGANGAVILAIQAVLWWRRQFSSYWEGQLISRLTSHEAATASNAVWTLIRQFYDARIFMVMTILALLILGSFILAGGASLRKQYYFLAAVALLSFGDLFFLSNIQWARPFVDEAKRQLPALRILQDGFVAPRKLGPWTIDPVAGTQYVLPVPDWGFRRHVAVLRKYMMEHARPPATRGARTKTDVRIFTSDAVRSFYGLDAASKRLFFTRKMKYDNINSFMVGVASARSLIDRIEIERYTGDVLIVKVAAKAGGWLSFVDNWDPHWTATVNGRTVTIEKLFGAYKEVPIPAGASRVEFAYRLLR